MNILEQTFLLLIIILKLFLKIQLPLLFQPFRVFETLLTFMAVGSKQKMASRNGEEGVVE